MGNGKQAVYKYSGKNTTQLKKLLIISPYFPPSNAADMQRIRMSLPYFKEFGWDVEVVTVDPAHSEMTKDELLLKNIPSEIKIHQVQAFEKKWTSKLGLGSIALRSLWFYKKYVSILLEKHHFDLIYFSTTQFPVMVLGKHWKKKYHIPYVIDMQDPWHSTYYENKPKAERPVKYWFSYRLNKFLEPIAMKNVDGLISVSQGYLDTLVERYPNLKNVPKKVITFGAYEADVALVKQQHNKFKVAFDNNQAFTHFVYVGRGGADMKIAAMLLFKAFKIGLKKEFNFFDKVRFHFIGTSYAKNGEGIKSIKPIADDLGISKYVHEQTDRISFYTGLFSLKQADALVILGSNDKQYTASKIYPFIMAEKPLLAIFHPESSARKILELCTNIKVISLLNRDAESAVFEDIYAILQSKTALKINVENFASYSAKAMTKNQCILFDQIITN